MPDSRATMVAARMEGTSRMAVGRRGVQAGSEAAYRAYQPGIQAPRDPTVPGANGAKPQPNQRLKLTGGASAFSALHSAASPPGC